MTSSGTSVFRTHDARDFACLLDVDPDVLGWKCVGVELSYGGETYLADFVVTGIDDRTFLVDVAHDLPKPPDWTALAADIREPVAAVVEEAIGWRRRLCE